MTEPMPSWLDVAPPEHRAALQRAAEGSAPNVVLMQILAGCGRAREADVILRDAVQTASTAGDRIAALRLESVIRVHAANPNAHAIVQSVLSGIDHGPLAAGNSPAAWGAAFDNAAVTHPEGSVALYALGDADLLTRATQEIVEILDGWGLIGPGVDCLDIGCGIGRVETALADRLLFIVGVDVSATMVAEARRRTAGLANVEIQHTSGSDLRAFGDNRFDLALAVDSFPYMVMSGDALVQAMFLELARTLRPGGRAILFNYSYRGDAARDADDLQRLASVAGLRATAQRDVRLTFWDATVFELRKPDMADANSQIR